jgi:amidase
MTAPQPADCWVPGPASYPPTGSGPLTGQTMAVKDLIAIPGHVSSFGHPRWRATHGPSSQLAPVLSRLLSAGASIAGLAKLDQIAWSVVGNVGEGVAPLNPAYPDRFTGGSSSGSAAAVAGGLADIGIGTDTGGSVRVPAAACGLYGLRTTHGLVSTDGVLPLAPAFDVVGFLTREPGLLGEVLSLAAADVPAAPAVAQVVVPVEIGAAAGGAALAAVRSVAAALADATGGQLIERDASFVVSAETADLFSRLQARQVWAVHGPWLAANVGVLAPDVAARVQRAEQLSSASAAERQGDERAWAAYTARLAEFAPADAIAVLPVMADLPVLRTASAADVQDFRASTLRLTAPASLTGRPEIVVPVAARGGPLGVGVLGPVGGDAGLIEVVTRMGPLAL